MMMIFIKLAQATGNSVDSDYLASAQRWCPYGVRSSPGPLELQDEGT